MRSCILHKSTTAIVVYEDRYHSLYAYVIYMNLLAGFSRRIIHGSTDKALMLQHL